MSTKLDQKIINLISQDIPLAKDPFKVFASRLGIEEKVLLRRIRSYKKKGMMRKFCASLNHKKIGFNNNAMVVWNIPDKRIDSAGKLMSSYPHISHCYQRRKAPGWEYNLYSMIHGKTQKECLDVIRDISVKTACKDYRVLFSSREYKKTPVTY
jgi:DNA-binding Lrp family transcriptional regulator